MREPSVLRKLFKLSFAVDTNVPTVVAKNSLYQNTMGHILPTFYDVMMMNTHYQCFGTFQRLSFVLALCSTQPSCQNGGIVDVNNCAQCVCPQSYGGTLCEQKANIH